MREPGQVDIGSQSNPQCSFTFVHSQRLNEHRGLNFTDHIQLTRKILYISVVYYCFICNTQIVTAIPIRHGSSI